MNSLKEFDSDTIENILTLRLNYNESFKSFIKKSSDFHMDYSINNPSDKIEKMIYQNMKEEIEKKNEKIVVTLSGGIDSSLLVAILKNKFPDKEIEAISVVFKDSFDESPTAKKIAEKLDINHQVLNIENFLEELPKAISIVKQPFWDLHWYYLMKKTKTISNIMISGDGADELFGGYTFRYKKFLSLVTDNSTPLEKTKSYLECHQRDWVPDQEKLFGKKINFSWEKIQKRIIPYFQNSLNNLQQIMLADFNGKLLHNFIPNNIKIKNYFNIQYITPFLSDELVSFATHLPLNLKYNKVNNEGKIILREILEKYKIKEDVNKRKQGFSVNTISFWNNKGRQLCLEYLTDSRIVKEGWIDSEWVKKHLQSTEQIDTRYVNKLLGILAMEIWFRIFITKEMHPDTKLR